MENKKNNIILPIIAFLVIIIIVIFVILKKDSREISPEPLTSANQELTNAIKNDDTKSIISNLDSISVENSVDLDLTPVDKELENL
jgi:uncharacterized membrane protein YvbJ